MMFQFLGRNSGRSDPVRIKIDAQISHQFQFLGRNSGRSDTEEHPAADWYTSFQFLGRNSGRSDFSGALLYGEPQFGFNSSVGILVVRTSFLSLICLV